MLAAFFAAAHAQTTINVDWSSVLRPLQTVPAFQTVVNPVTSRESPYHDQVYDKIASLGAQYQRYVPWLPYPRMGIAELEPPSHGGLCGFVNSGGAGNIWSTTLDCGKYGAGTIDAVVFADYGLPTGYCNSLKAGACTKDVKAAVAAACVGKASCTLLSSDATFGAAPCGGNRLAVEVTCSNKAVDTFTYWDFGIPDEGMLDFLAAADAGNRTAIPNFSTIPNWLFVNPDRSYFPDDPLGETWSYERGAVLVDPTGSAVGDYYGRLLAHYLEGGFTDEAGRWVPGYNLSFSHWEVLNEVNYEHHMTPAFYTILYDAIIAGIRKFCPRGCANLKFFGLGGAGEGYVPYFLNKSNHPNPATPIDFITIHSYASAQRDGGVNGTLYEAFFPHQANFVNSLSKVYDVIKASDYPNVLIDADEVGVILPDDNDSRYTAYVALRKPMRAAHTKHTSTQAPHKQQDGPRLSGTLLECRRGNVRFYVRAVLSCWPRRAGRVPAHWLPLNPLSAGPAYQRRVDCASAVPECVLTVLGRRVWQAGRRHRALLGVKAPR